MRSSMPLLSILGLLMGKNIQVFTLTLAFDCRGQKTREAMAKKHRHLEVCR